MRSLMYKLILFVTFVVIVSCGNKNPVINNQQTIKIPIDSIDYRISNYLNSLKFNSIVNIDYELDSKKIVINIYFESRYFIDDETNKLISSLIICQGYDYLVPFNEVTMVIKLKKFENEPLILNYSNENIQNIYKKSQNSTSFNSNAVYALLNLNSNDIVGYNKILEILNQNVKGFNFKGSFWLLLYEYSEDCKDSIKQKEFKLLVKSAEFEKFKVNSETLSYFLKNCTDERNMPSR